MKIENIGEVIVMPNDTIQMNNFTVNFSCGGRIIDYQKVQLRRAIGIMQQELDRLEKLN